MHSRVKVRLPPNLKTNIDKESKDGLTPIFENALRSRAHQPRSPCSVGLRRDPHSFAVATAKGLTLSSLGARALQAGRAETAIRRSPPKQAGQGSVKPPAFFAASVLLLAFVSVAAVFLVGKQSAHTCAQRRPFL